MKKIKYNERLTELMEEKGFSQRKLATKLGISQPSINRWLKGINEPDICNLLLLADLFEVSVDYLLGHETTDGIIQKENSLSKNERKLLDGYNQLNKIAKAKVLAYLDGLLENPLAKENIL